MNTFQVTDLVKQYGKEPVLDHLSFRIPRGKITVILGKNGAGKTTLIKLLLGMMSPTAGEITYEGTSLEQLGRSYYQQVGAILESVNNVYSFLSGRQNINYFLGLSNSDKTDQDPQIQKLIQDFELEAHMDKLAGSYSRGMTQKLALILALMTDAQTLFLDEPTLGVDFQSTKEICDSLRQQSKEQGKTIILTSHQSEIIESLADHVILLDRHQIVFEGSYTDFMARRPVEEVYLAKLGAELELVHPTPGVTQRLQDGKTVLEAATLADLISYLQDHQFLNQVESIDKLGSSLEETLDYFYTQREVEPHDQAL